jgi:hypothetical protein
MKTEQLAASAAGSVFGGLEVACWPLVLKFAGSHPAKAVGFLGRNKSSARLPLHFSPTVPPSTTGCLKRLQCIVENEKIVLLEGWGMAVLNE